MAILMPFCKTAVGKMGEGHVVHHSRKFSCGRLRGASKSTKKPLSQWDAANARLAQFITNFLEARHERFG
jgi:hypothetical protein